MSNPKRIVFVILLLSFAACERQAEVGKPIVYSKDGISFSIPGNWNITEDVEENGFRYLTIETPGDAIVSVSTYLKEDSIPLLEYVEWIIEASAIEISLIFRTEGTTLETHKLINGQTYNGYKNEFIVSAAGQEVPHVAEFFSFKSKHKTAYYFSQVAVEDMSKVREGFELVLSTFKLQ